MKSAVLTGIEPAPTLALAPSASLLIRNYDQIISGDVKIKKIPNSDHEYKITFIKKNISKVLMYQPWSSTSAALNGNRHVREMKAKYWVNLAIWVDRVNVSLNANANAILFTPTTVMEIGNNKYVFVINNARMENDHVIFYVSSNKITIPSNANKRLKKLKKIPTGKFHNVRFDIDSTPENICTTYYDGLQQYSSNTFLGNTITVNDICNNGFSTCVNKIETACPDVSSNAITTFCNGVQNMNSSNAYDILKTFSNAVGSNCT